MCYEILLYFCDESTVLEVGNNVREPPTSFTLP